MRLLVLAALIPAGASASEPAAPPAAPAAEAASAAPARGEARAKLMAADTDGDGSWSLNEWTAAGRRERGFKMMDADGNGVLTREELRAGVAERRERRNK